MSGCRFHQIVTDPGGRSAPGLCVAVEQSPRVPTSEEAALCEGHFESCTQYGHALRDRLRATGTTGVERGLPTLPPPEAHERLERSRPTPRPLRSDRKP